MKPITSVLLLFASMGCSSAVNMKSLKRTFYLQDSGDRMLEAVFFKTEKFRKMVDCFAYGDGLAIEAVLRNVAQESIVAVSEIRMMQLNNYCTYVKYKRAFPVGPQVIMGDIGYFNGMFIYPGTKWCGAGNISNGYDDLGPEIEADKCCRDHDHCNDSISGLDTKHGLHNTALVTKSHCDCDDQFSRCLQEANTAASNRIGKIYFNTLQMDCFRKDYPIIQCLEYAGWWPLRSCQKYELDREADQIWQFFDAKHYHVPGEDDDDGGDLGEDEQFEEGDYDEGGDLGEFKRVHKVEEDNERKRYFKEDGEFMAKMKKLSLLSLVSHNRLNNIETE